MIHSYKDIKYTLERSRRRSTCIYIERDGSVAVLVPEKMLDDEVEKLLESRRKWIYRHLAEWRKHNPSRPQPHQPGSSSTTH